MQRASNPIAYSILIAIFLYYAIEPVLTLFWLYGVADIIWVSKVLNVGVVVCLTAVLFARGRMVVDRLSAWMALMLIAGIIVGLTRGNSATFALSHLFYISFALVLYTGFRSLQLADVDARRVLRGFSVVLFFSAVGSLLYFWAIMLDKGYYPGLGLATLLIPFSFFLIRRNYVGALVCMLALLASGKRGVFIAFLIVVLVYFGMKRIRSFSTLAVISGCCLAMVLGLSFWALLQFDSSYPALSKWSVINPLSEETDVEVGSSGRWTEILRAYEAFSQTALGWIFGAGLGFKYQWWSDSGHWDYDPDRHYLHMSYLNYLFQYGIILTTVFLVLIYKILAIAYTYIRDHPNDIVSHVLFLYVIGKLTHAVFGFVLGADPLLWAALGMLAQRTAQARPSRPTAMRLVRLDRTAYPT